MRRDDSVEACGNRLYASLACKRKAKCIFFKIIVDALAPHDSLTAPHYKRIADNRALLR